MSTNSSLTCWPTEQQEFLLQAALLKGEEAVTAWDEWKASIDLDNLDPGSYRLLPLLYSNLSEMGVEDLLLKKLKGIYRHSWYRDQRLFDRIADLLQALGQAGIETMVLKEAALVLKYYKQCGLRPISSFNMLVRPEQLSDAAGILALSGWKPQFTSSLENRIVSNDSARFDHLSGRSLKLCQHVLGECSQAGADQDFWQHSTGIHIGTVSSRVLNPSDQLLHTCADGAHWTLAPSFPWLADAFVVLDSCGAELDWTRLVAVAKKQGLVMPVKQTLRYLQDNLHVRVPSHVSEKLEDAPVSKMERIVYRAGSRATRNVFETLLIRWSRYLKTADDSGFFRRLAGFPRYLCVVWDLGHFGQLPVCMADKLIWRLKKALSRQSSQHRWPGPDSGRPNRSERKPTGYRTN